MFSEGEMNFILTNNQIITLGKEVIYNKIFFIVKKERGMTAKRQLKLFFKKLCVSILHGFITAPHAFLQRPREAVVSSGMGVRDRYELPCRYWQLNLGPLEEHPVFLTHEPFLQPQVFVLLFIFTMLSKHIHFSSTDVKLIQKLAKTELEHVGQ